MPLIAFTVRLARIDESLLYRDPGGARLALGGLLAQCGRQGTHGRRTKYIQGAIRRYAAGERGPALGTWREIGAPKTRQPGRPGTPGFDPSKLQEAAHAKRLAATGHITRKEVDRVCDAHARDDLAVVLTAVRNIRPGWVVADVAIAILFLLVRPEGDLGCPACLLPEHLHLPLSLISLHFKLFLMSLKLSSQNAAAFQSIVLLSLSICFL